MKSDGTEAAMYRDVSISMKINVSEIACKLRSLFYPPPREESINKGYLSVFGFV